MSVNIGFNVLVNKEVVNRISASSPVGMLQFLESYASMSGFNVPVTSSYSFRQRAFSTKSSAVMWFQPLEWNGVIPYSNPPRIMYQVMSADGRVVLTKRGFSLTDIAHHFTEHFKGKNVVPIADSSSPVGFSLLVNNQPYRLRLQRRR